MSVHLHDKYQFHITAPDGSTWQAYPRNASLEWKWEKDQDWSFFRKTLSTDLVFVNDPERSIDDFDRLLAIEESDSRCQFILIDVTVICGPVNMPWWSGRIRCSAGEWDKTYCRLKVKAEPNDDYTCLFDNWEKELDFASALDGYDLTAGVEYDVETKICEWEETRFTGGLIIDPDPPAVVDLIDLLNEGGTNVPFLDSLRAVLLLQVFLHCSDYLDAGTSAWSILKAEYTHRLEFHQVTGSFHHHYQIRFTIVRETALGTCSGITPVKPDSDTAWILLTDNCPTDSVWVRKLQVLYDGGTGVTLITINNAYKLSEVLQWYTGTFGENPDMSCTIPIISNFFNINPDDTAPDNLPYQKAAVGLSDVHIMHFSDFIKDDENGPDTEAFRSFSLQSILKSLPGNIGITLDSGTLRIEHASYFRRIKMLDITDAPLIQGRYQYKYNKPKLPKEEEFTWKALTDGKGNDFDGLSITYDSACIDGDNKKQSYSYDQFYTNIQFIYSHKDDYVNSLDGLLILSVADGKILFDRCPISTTLRINGHFALSTLHENYYKWDRPLSTGIMNGQPTQFLRWLRQKQQSDLKYQLCCTDYDTFDPDDLVKTQPGWGEVDEAVLVEPTGMLTLQLLHH